MTSIPDIVALLGTDEQLAGLSLVCELTGGSGNAAEREAHLASRHLPPPDAQAAAFGSAGAVPALLGALRGALSGSGPSGAPPQRC